MSVPPWSLRLAKVASKALVDSEHPSVIMRAADALASDVPMVRLLEAVDRQVNAAEGSEDQYRAQCDVSDCYLEFMEAGE